MHNRVVCPESEYRYLIEQEAVGLRALGECEGQPPLLDALARVLSLAEQHPNANPLYCDSHPSANLWYHDPTSTLKFVKTESCALARALVFCFNCTMRICRMQSEYLREAWISGKDDIIHIKSGESTRSCSVFALKFLNPIEKCKTSFLKAVAAALNTCTTWYVASPDNSAYAFPKCISAGSLFPKILLKKTLFVNYYKEFDTEESIWMFAGLEDGEKQFVFTLSLATGKMHKGTDVIGISFPPAIEDTVRAKMESVVGPIKIVTDEPPPKPELRSDDAATLLMLRTVCPILDTPVYNKSTNQ